MNKRFLPVLAMALLIAGAATLLFWKLMAGRPRNEPKAIVTTRLVVAARNLAVGTLLRDPDLSDVDWPGALPDGANTRREDVLGRGVIATMYKGEPVLNTRLAPKGAGAGLAATIPPGMRAVAVRVNEIIGVGGFVVPGMRVDVLISGAPPDAPKSMGTLSRTLLQNIEVLSAGQNIQKDQEGKPISVPVVNLLVTPAQAETLNLASTETKIQLVLRNPLDTEVAKTSGTAVANLFTGGDFKMPGSEPPPKPRIVRVTAPKRPQPKPVVVVEVIEGSKKTQTKFQEPED